MVSFKLNGKQRDFDGDADTPLLWVIRDEFGLTGTKFGCGVAFCGACTVYANGNPLRSCSFPVSAAAGMDITTIEGLSGPVAKAVQTAWREEQVPQCGWCQSGQVMAAASLLSRDPNPSDQTIDQQMSANICRCATYHRIRAAIHRAAKLLQA